MNMSIIEQFLSGEMNIDDFKKIYHDNPETRELIDSILTDDAKELPEHPLWERTSYDSIKKAGFSISKQAESQGAFDGSLGDDLNLHGLIATYYVYYHPGFQPTDLYDKQYEFYLEAVGEYYEGPEVRDLLNSIIRNNMDISPKTKRIRETRTLLKRLFHVDNNSRPYWIQGAAWPMGEESPMKYIKQKKTDDKIDYYFEDVDTKDTRIVTQYY